MPLFSTVAVLDAEPGAAVEPDAVPGPADDTAAVLKTADVGGRDARGIGLNVTALVQGRAAGPQAAYADPVRIRARGRDPAVGPYSQLCAGTGDNAV